MPEEWERLPFDEAIAFLRDKLALPSEAWDTLSDEAQNFAFSIAGLTRAEILADIQESLVKALEQGTTFQQFRKNFDTIAARRGWNPQFGAYRTELIFSQNLRTAYAAGRYQQMSDPDVTKTRKWWLYRHRDSRTPRPAHLAMDGKVFS